MKKLLLTCLLLLGIGASSQIVVNEGFEGTTTPTGFTYDTFLISSEATRLCNGAAALNGNFFSFLTTGNVTYASTASNGTALAVSFNYNTKEFNPGDGVGGTYKVEYSVNGGTTYTQIGSDIVVSSVLACTPFTGTVATGLIPADANFRLRISGLWTSGDFYFNVDDLVLQQVVSCNAPSLANITAVNTTNATLNWTAATTAPANGYDVYYSTSPTPPISTTTPNLTNITGTTALMTALMPATKYYAFVRSNCSAADQSYWVAAPSFLTPCVVVTNFSQNFDTVTIPELPVCWAKVGTLGFAFTETGAVGSSPNVMNLEPFTAGGLAVVKMPSVSTLQLGTYRLKFKLRANFTSGGKVEVGYLTNPTDDTSFVALESFTANSTTVADNYTVNAITAPAGVQDLAFRHTAVPSNSVLIDDVIYELTPTCADPGSLSTSNVTTTTVDIAWTAPTTAPANGYDVYYSTTNVAPTAATVPIVTGISNTAMSTTISSLTPSTTYFIYIRSNCSSTDKSPWVNATSFTTVCLPITTLPWSENFDAMTTLGANILPPCWISQGFQQYTSANAASNTFNDPRSNPNYVTVYYPNGTSYLWSPGFTLTAGQSYDFSFYWAVGDNTSGWQGDVLVNSSQAEAGSTPLGTSFVIPATTTTPTYNQSKKTFVPTTTGTYYFGVKTFSTIFAPYIMGFDDFKLELTPTCAEPTNVTTTAITSTSATLGWTAPLSAPANGYEYSVSTTNTAPASGIATTATSIPLNSLMPSTTYYVFVRSMCSGPQQSTWATFSFTTLATPPANDDCSVPIAITAGGTFAQNALTGTNVGATNTTDATATTTCQSIRNKDVWYSVVVPASGNLTIETGAVTGSTVTDTVLGVYSGSCGTLTEVGCNDDTGNGTFSKVVLTGQAPGSTLLFAVFDYSSTTTGTFQVSAYDGSLSTSNIVKGESGVNIFPNPFSDFVRISDVKDVVSISIVDMAGRMVKTLKPASEINLSSLKSGLYLVNLIMKDGSVKTVKAIKK